MCPVSVSNARSSFRRNRCSTKALLEEFGVCLQRSPNSHPHGEPPLVVGGAYLGLVQVKELLISRGADLEIALTDIGEGYYASLLHVKAVHAAILGEKNDALRVQLQAGANPNSIADQCSTPLILICSTPYGACFSGRRRRPPTGKRRMLRVSYPSCNRQGEQIAHGKAHLE